MDFDRLRAFAEAGYRLRVQFEMDAAPQEHLSMVASGMGCSIVPLSSLNVNLKLLDRVQQLSSDRFDYQLGVWAVWSERCTLGDRLVDALPPIFATATELLAPKRASSSRA